MDLYQLRFSLDFGRRSALTELAEAAVALKADELQNKTIALLVERVEELERRLRPGDQPTK